MQLKITARNDIAWTSGRQLWIPIIPCDNDGDGMIVMMTTTMIHEKNEKDNDDDDDDGYPSQIGRIGGKIILGALFQNETQTVISVWEKMGAGEIVPLTKK